MGCSESKIDSITTVKQCKERIAFIKQSISAYASFVSAHFAYANALKNTGVALCDYAQSEIQSPDDRPTPPRPSHHSSFPPPPPQRENNGVLAWDFFIALMEDAIDSGIEKSVIKRKALKNPNGDGGVVKNGKERLPPSVVDDIKNVNLMKVFRELGDGFIKASESANKALKIHEANKFLYHSSFADNQGQIKHSVKVIRVFNDGKVEFSSKEKENQATLLDKMLAWENRLYDQVKAGEKTKHEYQKRMASLNKHRKRDVSGDRLKHTEATENHIHARYTVEMQSIDLTISEINRLRDQHLYPKLVQIVVKMGEMWENMRKQHEQQLTIVQRLINDNIKISQLPNNTSENNSKNIEQIHLVLKIWCSEFGSLILHQKEYIKSLNNWLKLNPILIDHNIKPRNPKIASLLRTWNDQIEKLPEIRAKTAINSFASVIATIVQYQSEEMKMKDRCDEIRREIEKKWRKYEEWCDKQISKSVPSGEMDDMDVILEKQVVVDVLQRRLKEAEEDHRRCRVQVKDVSSVKLTAALTEVFTATAEFSGACSRMHGSMEPR